METVCILMSTYNGEKYLKEQLDSILCQKDVKIKLLVRDDSSTDKTVEILEKYKEKKLLEYYSGENLKPAHSFMNLLYNAPEADYYAFSDQDDFWMDNKLKEAIIKLKTTSPKKEAIYFSNVEVVDSNLNHISYGSNKKRISLSSSFVHSPAIGCTMVINKNMREKIIEKDIKNLEIGLHDSWIYRVALIINAYIIYDENSYIKYRQHENNVVGAKKDKKILTSIKEIFKVRKKTRSFVAKNLLNLYEAEISPENKEILQDISKLNHVVSIKDKMKIIFNKRYRVEKINSNIKFFYDILKNRI